MPALARLLMVQLTMGRLPAAYVISSAQNAQILIVTTHSSVKTLEDDAALHTLSVGHHVDATAPGSVERATAIPGYTAALDARASEPLPAWRSANTSGTYGVLYHRTFEQEYMLQQRARAVEDAYLKPRVDTTSSTVPTRVLGLCTMEVEMCISPSYVRFLTQAEVRAGITWSVKSWEKEIATEIRARVPVTLAGTDEAALSHALLESRASMEQAALGARQTYALEQMAPLFRPAAPGPAETVEVTKFLHISAVVGHPGSPGAGSCALDKACEVADVSGMPLVLEALPNRLLFAYYARWGFRPVVWLGTRADAIKNFNPRVSILMYRAPKTTVAAAEAAAAEEGEADADVDDTRSELDVASMVGILRYAESEDARAMSTELLRRPFSIPRADIRPEAMHLTVETEALVNPMFVWAKVSGSSEVYVDGAYSWAREYVRQVRGGEWGAVPLRLPLPDPVPALPLAVTPTSGPSPTASSSSSSGDGNMPSSFATFLSAPSLERRGASSSGSASGGGGGRRRAAAQISSALSPSPMPLQQQESEDEEQAPPPAQRPRTDRPSVREQAVQTSPMRPVPMQALQAQQQPFSVTFHVQAGGIVYFNYPPQLPQVSQLAPQ